jgi:hypothetical protein
MNQVMMAKNERRNDDVRCLATRGLSLEYDDSSVGVVTRGMTGMQKQD